MDSGLGGKKDCILNLELSKQCYTLLWESALSMDIITLKILSSIYSKVTVFALRHTLENTAQIRSNHTCRDKFSPAFQTNLNWNVHERVS